MKTKILSSILMIIMGLSNACIAQRSIQGLVTDPSKNPISGVIVESDHLSEGTRTDANGHFRLEVDSLTRKLVFTFPGMKTEEIVLGPSNTVNVTLAPEVIQLEELYETAKAASMANFSPGKKNMRMAQLGQRIEPNYNTEDYSGIHESGYRNVWAEPLSTFSVDVDRASYSNVRRFLNMGQLPPTDAVRIEEMINYFNYNYPEPAGNDPFELLTEYTTCPWNDQHQLILVGLQTRHIATNDLPPSNLVFLIDVSGSMQAPNKLPLVQSSLKMLTNNLRAQDKVALVVYAGSAGIVLESTPGSNKQKINEAIDRLKAGGSTAGGEGLKLAYKVASENFMKNGNNRIIIATDGDFNVGQSSDAEMERLVTQQSHHNIFLSVLGFGMGNLKDNKLETMADNGNGNYAYIDNSQEAQKVLIEEFGGTLFTVAKDVKIQLEFNPAQVKAYRLVGYENRKLENEDFNNDKKDAGDLGAGHQVTALYEIVPANSDEETGTIDELKYQKPVQGSKYMDSKEVLTLKIRYKLPDSGKSNLMQDVLDHPCTNFSSATDNVKLAASIAQFGMLLRDSEFKGESTTLNTIAMLESILSKNNQGYIEESIRLIKVAESLGLSDQHSL